MDKNGNPTLRSSDEKKPGSAFDPDCCGQHEVCERENITTKTRTEIEYYDDEELDQYCGFDPDLYDEKAVEAFSEVLYTMQAREVSGWLYSLYLRNIRIPDQLKDEALLLIEEQRNTP